jgi:predicted ATP-dependent serine protease
VSMVDWTTGKLNARLTVLELLKNNVGPGDELADTEMKNNGLPADTDAIAAQAFISSSQTAGGRKLVLINQRNREIVVELPKECAGATLQSIGGVSPDLVKQDVGDLKVRLLPFSVSVVTLKD